MRDPAGRLAVVVYESMFGNTEAVARAIAEGLHSRFDVVDVVDVASAPLVLDEFDLVVVGGPTHALGLSRANTREAARDQGAPAGADRGVREWLAEVAKPSTPAPAAACFDTRIRKPFLPGSAARAIRRRLRRLGFDVYPPISFTVTGTPGPLAIGELDRAQQFGAAIPAPAPTAVSEP